eukprot:278977_1
MSEVDSFFLQTNLNELNSPHKLSRYILALPHYKASIIGDNNNTKPNSPHNRKDSCSLQDLIITNKLSEFIYQQRLNGRFFLYNFIEKDFQNMMSAITSQITYDESKSDQDENNYDWIWQVLNNNINSSKHKAVIESKTDPTVTLNWISSSFDKYETVFNYNKFINSEEKKTMDCICVSVYKCKALKRLIMVLHFYQSLIDQIEKDNYLLVQYFRNNANIYTDYRHIFDKYIIESSQINVNKKNVEIIKDKIKRYIKCEVNDCISYKRKDNKFLKECIHKMQNGNINKNNMVDFCSEIMDVIHCYFVHNFSFTIENTHINSKNSNDVVKGCNTQTAMQKKAQEAAKKAKKDDKNQSFGCLSFICL